MKAPVFLGYQDRRHADGKYFLSDERAGIYIVKFDKQEVSWVNTQSLLLNRVELVLRRYEHGGTHEVCNMEFESEDRARQAAYDLRIWAFGHDVMSRNY